MTAPATGWALRAVRGGQYVLMQHTPSGMWTDIATCDNLIGPGHAGRQT